LNDYKAVVFDVRPDWSFTKGEKNWSLVYPKIEDVKLLVNVCYHCDVVINNGSTMAHDFDIYYKPALYLHDVQPDSFKWTTKVIYDFQHFRSIGELDAVSFVNSKDDIQSKLRLALDQPHLIAKDRKKWLEKIISVSPALASENIADEILK
jgi:hypothetical protein